MKQPGAIPAIAIEMAPQLCRHLLHWLAVIHFTGRDSESQQLTLIINYQMQLEAKVPFHRAFAPTGLIFEDFVLFRSIRMTYRY